MGMPAKLLDFTSPVVETALKTGARGSTSTTTNYGVIGDAMFKKAQLDLGIANLQADIGIRSAGLLSGLEMQKASMNFDMAKVEMDQNMRLKEMKNEIEANEVGFFEALFQDIAGGVAGAATGFMVGGPVGAAIGGGIGFAGTAASQAQGGRRAGQSTVQALGNIANGASMIKGLSTQAKAEDAMKGWSDKAQWLSGMIGNPQVRPEHQQQAMQQLDQHFGALGGELISAGYNPQQAAEAVQGMRGVYGGGGGGGARGPGGGGGKGADWSNFMAAEAFQAKADDRLNDPATSRQAKKEYLARAEMAFAQAHGGQEMSETQQTYYSDAIGINRAEAPTRLNKTSVGTRKTTAMEPENVNPSTLANDVRQQRASRPQAGQPINQPPPQYSAPVSQTPAGRGPLVVEAIKQQGPGLQMDQPVVAEQQLAQQGGEAVKVLDKQDKALTGKEELDEEGNPIPGTEKRGLWDKILHGGDLGNFGKDRDGDGEGDGVATGLLGSDGAKKDKANQIARQRHEDLKSRRDWDQDIEKNKAPEDKPFFKEKDSRKIQDAYDFKGKKFEGDEKAKAEGTAAAAAQMNQLREEMDGMWDVEGLDRETLKDYQTWKLGSVGEEGMVGEGKSIGAKGLGVSWQKFEKSVRLSLEGKGIRGKAANEVIQKLRSIDSKVEPLAQSLAVAKQGSRPSDADVAAYKKNLVNMMDPNPDNSIAGLVSLQELIYEDFRSFMYNTPSRSKFLSQKAEEGRAGRMTPGEIQARRAPTKATKKAYWFD